MKTTNIGILGSGDVGNASQGSFAEVAKFGEILVLATLGQAAEAARK